MSRGEGDRVLCVIVWTSSKCSLLFLHVLIYTFVRVKRIHLIEPWPTIRETSSRNGDTFIVSMSKLWASKNHLSWKLSSHRHVCHCRGPFITFKHVHRLHKQYNDYGSDILFPIDQYHETCKMKTSVRKNLNDYFKRGSDNGIILMK